MLIRKNTKPFKTILAIITACQHRIDREKLVRLYITKAGHSIIDRISVEGIQGESDVFYGMNYQAVLNNLKSPNHQLYHSDEVPGIYFFQSASIKAWDQTPFEFGEAIRNEFASLPELPVVRKKEKPQKFVLPVQKVKTSSPPVQNKKITVNKPLKIVERAKQPGYKLKHKIQFTELEKVIFRQAQRTKKDVLDYYNKIAEHILPYLKDRPQLIRLQSDHTRAPEYFNLESLSQHIKEELPAWIQTSPVIKEKEKRSLLLCNDREHLLFYAEIGCLQFNPWHARTKSPESPDYIVIGIDPPEAAFAKAINVALVAKEILEGLQLPAFIKTDGICGLHIYIPLDSKSKFETGKKVGGYICRLIRLKIPELVSLKGFDEHSYGKVSLDYLINGKGQTVVAPYSLVSGNLAIVATPLLWAEVKAGFQVDDFNDTTIFKRLKTVGDPFADLFKKKANADALLQRIEANYAFLF